MVKQMLEGLNSHKVETGKIFFFFLLTKLSSECLNIFFQIKNTHRCNKAAFSLQQIFNHINKQ